MTWSLQPGKEKGPTGIEGESSYSSAEQQQQHYCRCNNNDNNSSNGPQLLGNDSYITNTSSAQYSNDKQCIFNFYDTIPSAHLFHIDRASTTETAFIHCSAPSSTDMAFASSPFSNRPNTVASQELEQGRGMSIHQPSSTSFGTDCYEDEFSQQQEQQQQQQTYYNMSSRSSSSSSLSLLSTSQRHHHSVTSSMMMLNSTTATTDVTNNTCNHSTVGAKPNLTSQRDKLNISQQMQHHLPVELMSKPQEQLISSHYHILQRDRSTLPSQQQQEQDQEQEQQQQPLVSYYSVSQHTIPIHEHQQQQHFTNLEGQQHQNTIAESSNNLCNREGQQASLLLIQEPTRYITAAAKAIIPTESMESSLSSLRATTRRSISEHPQRRQHQCPICKHTFTKHHDLIRHFPTHIPESRRVTYPCPDCDNYFYRKDSITRHRGTSACPKNKENSNNNKDNDNNNSKKN